MGPKNRILQIISGRLILALILAGAALLLIGAGRLGDSMATRQEEQEAAHSQWRKAAGILLEHQQTAGEQNRALRKLANLHPEILLQTLHTGLRHEDKN